MIIFLSPHNDDEALFGSYTIVRRKPLVVVVTDSWIQLERADRITAGQRRRETIDAMRLLGAPVEFLGIRDTELTRSGLTAKLRGYHPDKVYAPLPNSKNQQHSIVGEVAHELWPGKVIFYSTYTHRSLTPEGEIEIIPKPEEIRLKDRALNCYRSQIKINSAHFSAVRGRSEFLNDPHKEKVSAVLVKWKRTNELEQIVDHLRGIGFIDEIIVWDNTAENRVCYSRYLAAITKARNDTIYVQDDDCIVENIPEIYSTFDGGHLSNGIKPERVIEYANQRGQEPYITLVGWGAFFKKDWVSCLDRYLEKYGEDDVLHREADRIFTYLLARHHNTIEARIRDLPSASGEMALYLEHDHKKRINETKRRLETLIGTGKPGLVSAIIATRDRPNYLNRTLDTLTRQTYWNIQIVVVDDGSSPDVPRMIKRYPVDKFVKTEHVGAAAARNEGFLQSEGEFVIFCDDDLELEPNMIERLLDTLQRNPSKAYAYCGFRQTEKNDHQREMSPVEFDSERLIDANYISVVSLIRRSEFLEAGMFDPSLRRLIDWDLWLSLLEKGEQGILVPETLFTHMRVDGPRISDGEKPESLPAGEAREIIATKHLRFYRGFQRHRPLIALVQFIQRSNTIARALPYGTTRGELRKIVTRSFEITLSRGILGFLRMASEKIRRREFKILD